MKILLIADHEDKALWDYWSKQTQDRLADVNLILSAGDLDADYLEFLVTMLNVPLVYRWGVLMPTEGWSMSKAARPQSRSGS